jgi:hypothetical protein
MQSIIYPTYFPSIAHFVILANSEIIFEDDDNYQKQTYRNRTYLYGPSGKQLLSVPMIHTKSDGHQKFKEVRIENNFNWQKQHWKTLETAYRTSPFFEFYEDEIQPIFEKKHTFLMDLNFETIELVCDCLQFETDYKKTSNYKILEEVSDYKNLASVKSNDLLNFDNYVQVFSEKYGYINNLSILDLLFNEGTNALTYLEKQKTKL